MKEKFSGNLRNLVSVTTWTSGPTILPRQRAGDAAGDSEGSDQGLGQIFWCSFFKLKGKLTSHGREFYCTSHVGLWENILEWKKWDNWKVSGNTFHSPLFWAPHGCVRESHVVSRKGRKSRALQYNVHRWWLPCWSYYGEPLCTLYGRAPFKAYSHPPLFYSLQLSVTQLPISLQLNTSDDCLRILNSPTYPVPEPSFHCFSIGSSSEA